MNWLRRLMGRNQLEQQLDKELQFHIDQHTEDLVAQGHSPKEARRLARLEFGGPEQVKELCRDARGTRWLEDLVHDTRYALRTLRQKPGFAAVALLTLALGIGATTIMFTIINGVLLKPLPSLNPISCSLCKKRRIGARSLEICGLSRIQTIWIAGRTVVRWTWPRGGRAVAPSANRGTPNMWKAARFRPNCSRCSE